MTKCTQATAVGFVAWSSNLKLPMFAADCPGFALGSSSQSDELVLAHGCAAYEPFCAVTPSLLLSLRVTVNADFCGIGFCVDCVLICEVFRCKDRPNDDEHGDN